MIKCQKNILLGLGWKLFEESQEEIKDINDFSLYPFVTSSEEYATWDMMLDRARKFNAYGSQNIAEYFLSNQKNIPTEWQKYNIIFPNTTWESSTDHKLCPYLSYRTDKWVLDYYWFLYDFHHNDRFMIVK